MTSATYPWVDVLGRKHECGPSLSPYVAVGITVGGRSETLHMPDHFEDGGSALEVRAVIGDGSLIVVIATHPGNEEVPEPSTILMVARRSDDAPFVVHVWHELYPRALDHFGLADESPADQLPGRSRTS
ncbi:hypothetical protein [Tautonia plasticadhaerens]|uniref:Uncharacterized protein n=1 Tax=Tautonia plasticadhaerens TaxID=2527974 RepID=A0A518GZF4_9BACT|nr:hypothetical protein [Tautonia plasticadhaerens]QDV33960.1 hypothetical protein ElP_18410 [Tautonia plasticadhaerens]